MAKLTESQRAAKEAMEKAVVAMKKSYNVGKCLGHEYSKGDQVWLDTQNLKMDQPSKKLDNKHAGHFMVEEKVGPAGYRLKLPWAWHIRSSMSCCWCHTIPPPFPLRSSHHLPLPQSRTTTWSMRLKQSLMSKRWGVE